MTKDELLFNAWLTSLNHRLGRYVVRLMDEANATAITEYTVLPAEVEAALGEDLRELAEAILARSLGLALPVQHAGGQAGNRPHPMPEL
ncbi:hypothetical protein ACQPZF_24925 [Actinosynnema sp. CS-041913]|uniref:hypothetical protein n=1 Tax=Actinosynnema sp. CS-041913 TaxID=3239917 RepID=UPI003D93246F